MRTLQSGPVTVIDYRCPCGPSDRPFTESHAKHSISYVRKGSFGYRWLDQSFELVAGSVLVGHPGDEYMCTHEHHHGGDECLSFQYTSEAIDEIGCRAQWRVGALPPVAELMVLGEWAQTAANADSDVGLDELGLMLGARLAQVTTGKAAGTSKLHSRDRRRAVETALWIDANARDDIDLLAAAKVAGLSSYHFLRVFSAVVGVTPHQYLVRARLRNAARLLVESEQPIIDVALGVGFNDVSNFVRTFGRAAGASPRAFRHAARGNRNFLQESGLPRT
ncbi:helix-turn-helix transcriptional regulator [Steroidobacter sp.]|uniref:helix-turn-helix transcriptional regulator n=1 Tax=Steroidobacter sp. TaxID=1978227 RepID=UPI001A4663E3|nr:AraC family transcriptional regulator [Steroidobacter sp.]MBL8267885.1 helix-turn-helix transcriptional regulator [Steroidobacter sp.]